MASRRADRSLAIDPAGAYRIRSSAGPLEVAPGPEPRLDYRASWLMRGPEVGPGTAPPTSPRIGAGGAPVVAVELSCDTRWPCRASARFDLPPESDLEATSTAGPLVVGAVDGRITATTTGEDAVLLGPMTGSVRAATERGDVVGTGLAAREVEVETAAGAVRLAFRERPRSVDVVAGGEPVTIELPPGRYAVTVVGSPSATIDVHRDEAADSRIRVDGRGPVRITSTP